jgi:hypothetical protein
MILGNFRRLVEQYYAVLKTSVSQQCFEVEHMERATENMADTITSATCRASPLPQTDYLLTLVWRLLWHQNRAWGAALRMRDNTIVLK